MDKSAFFAKDLEALDEFMGLVGFESIEPDEPWVDARYYIKDCGDIIKSITLKSEAVDENQELKLVLLQKTVDKYVIYQEESKPVSDDDIPF